MPFPSVSSRDPSPGRKSPTGLFSNQFNTPPTRTFGPGWTKATAAGLGVSSAVVPLPTECLDGQPYDNTTVLVMFVATTQTNTVTTPSGWTIIGAALDGGTGVRELAYYKIPSTADAGSAVTISYTAGDKDFGVIVAAVRGVDTVNPVTATFTNGGSTGSTLSGPTLTGILPTDIILEHAAARPDSANPGFFITEPGGPSATDWQPTTDVKSNEKEWSGFPSSSALVYKVGATDSPTWTWSVNSEMAVRAVQLAAVSAVLQVNPAGIPSEEKTGSVTVTPGDVTVSPVGISDSSAVGAVTVANAIAPVGVPTGESVGDSEVAQSPTPVGVPSGQNLGNPTVSATYTVSPSGIPSAEGEGSPSLAQAVAASGIPSGEAEGSVVVTATATISPYGVSSSERAGQVSLGLSVAPHGVPGDVPPGNPTLSATYTVSPAGIPSAASSGDTNVEPVVSPVGVQGTDRLGNPTVTVVVGVNPTGIGPGDVGTPAVSTTYTISPSGINGGSAVGPPSVANIVTLSPSAVPSGDGVGNPAVTTVYTVSPIGIGSDGAVGAPGVTSQRTVSPIGVPSSEKAGNPALTTLFTVAPFGISTSETFGSPGFRYDLFINPTGLSADSGAGFPAITQTDSKAKVILVYKTPELSVAAQGPVSTTRPDNTIPTSKYGEIAVRSGPEISVSKD